MEQVNIGVILIEGAEEEGVDAEEGAELLVEIVLLNVCARGRRDPEILRVALKEFVNKKCWNGLAFVKQAEGR